MDLSGNYLVGTMEKYKDPVKIPIVEHPEADEKWISLGEETPIENAKQYKFIGIKMDFDKFSPIDFDADKITEDDVEVYHALAARENEDGDLRSHWTVEVEGDNLDGFLAAVNNEQLPLNEPLRVGDLEGHVGHVIDALTSEIALKYLSDAPVLGLEREDLPDGVEFELRSHSTLEPEVEILDLGGLAKEQLNRDFQNFQDLYSRTELDADEYQNLRNRVENQELMEEDRLCAELSGCELETKEVTICVPSEFFDKQFETQEEYERKYQAINSLPEDELREKARKNVLEATPIEDTYEVLCGVNWNGE